jgi:hypothetical protein
MNALTGMEKFSHLEDKIYLTIEYAKKLRDEKERLEVEVEGLRRDTAAAIADKRLADEKVTAMMAERDEIQLKVEAMLEAIAVIDEEVAKAVGQ